MKVCILYGGKSGEHDVSLRSAASVIANLDRAKYEVTAIGIDKRGRWHLQDVPERVRTPGEGERLTVAPSRIPVTVAPSDGIYAGTKRLPIDCVFPVLHGSYGEDGTMQGLLETAGLPYVGAGVLGSAASMDKEAAKRLWRDARLPVVDFIVVPRLSEPHQLRNVGARLGWPVFVKPCSAGSSLGASRAADERELEAALAEAWRYDTRALIERYVKAREIECAVLGNFTPRALVPGEIIPGSKHTFYDYHAKYTDPDGATLVTRAALDDKTQKLIMSKAEAAYAAVRCEGMARVDFFLEDDTGAVFVNEINTIPGFTSISMFPRMCEASGLSYPALLDTLIELAMERASARRRLRLGE